MDWWEQPEILILKVGVDGNPTRYKWACMLVHRY